MKTLITILLLISSVLVQGQNLHDVPNFFRQNIDLYYWPTDSNESQKEHWDNGNLKVEYIVISDSLKVRKEYYNSGNLKYELEVYQAAFIDTMMAEDLETGYFTTTISHGFRDLANGRYHEYWDTRNEFLTVSGQFKMGLQVGEWLRMTPYEHYEVISREVMTYNEEGNPEGSYFEYYNYNEKMDRTQIKWKGQFGSIKESGIVEDLETGEIKEFTNETFKRMEKWIHYDRNGEVKEVVCYECKTD